MKPDIGRTDGRLDNSRLVAKCLPDRVYPITKQFRRVSDPREIQRAIDSGEEHYRIYTKDPNVQAFTDLMNRALDKPIEPVQVQQDVNVDINLEIRKKLDAALIREQKMIETRKNGSD